MFIEILQVVALGDRDLVRFRTEDEVDRNFTR